MAKRKMAVGLVSIGSIAHLLFIAIATLGVYFSASIQPVSAAECDPDDIECIGYAQYCIDNPSNLNCVGMAEYCEATPGAAVCIGYIEFCNNKPGSGPCVGNTTYCAQNPNTSACMGRVNYCEQNPNDKDCLGKVAMCAGRETEGTCPDDLAYCSAYPEQWSCIGFVAYCEENPGNSNCSGLTEFCAQNSESLSCVGYLNHCPANPDDRSCKGYVEFCAGNEESVDCQGYTSYCPQFPDDASCIGTAAIDESAPPNVQARCSESGSNVYLTWDSVARVSSYAVRINYVENDDASCPSGWLCDGNDWQGDVSGASHTGAITPGKPYSVWVHSIIGGQTGPSSSAVSFNCAPPPVSCVDNPELPECPGSPAYCAMDEHRSEPICTVGNPAWCNSGYHDNNENCPGTISYCEAHPRDPLCDVVDVPGYSDGTTSFSVYETSKSTGVGTVLCNAMYYIKSNIGAPLATLLVISLGILAMVRKVSWKRIIFACVGISAIFGASQLTTFVGSNVAEEEDAVLKCLTNE